MGIFIKRRSAAAGALAVGLALVLACGSAMAGSFDFEDPPYTVGALAGQEGWLIPSYSNTTNGQAEVSTNAALSGSQSLYYLRAAESQPSFFDANDVGKPDVVTAVANGTPATDLTFTYLTKGLPNGLGGDARGGPYLGADTVGGNSPIFVQLNASEVQVLVSDEKGTNINQRWETFDSYTPGDVIGFKLDVDFDDFVFDVATKNVTLGETEYTPLGPGTFDFADPFSDDGDGVSYTVDLGVALRDGQIWIDDAVLTPIPEPSTLLLLTCALVSLGLIRRRFR